MAGADVPDELRLGLVCQRRQGEGRSASGPLDDPDTRPPRLDVPTRMALDVSQGRHLALAVGMERDVDETRGREESFQHLPGVEELMAPAVEGSVRPVRVRDDGL